MFELSEVVLISFFIAFYLYWSSAQRVKEIAFQATRSYCLKMEIQMLDGYVALNQLRFKRDERGKIRVWRSFNFEFTSTGEERYNGRIILLGQQILSIQLDPHRISRED